MVFQYVLFKYIETSLSTTTRVYSYVFLSVDGHTEQGLGHVHTCTIPDRFSARFGNRSNRQYEQCSAKSNRTGPVLSSAVHTVPDRHAPCLF